MRYVTLRKVFFTLVVFTAGAFAQSDMAFTRRVDSTTSILGDECYTIDLKTGSTVLSTEYLRVVNDTVRYVGFMGSEGEPEPLDYVFTPLSPTVGTSWQGWSGDPATYCVMKQCTVTVPDGEYEVYMIEIRESPEASPIGKFSLADGVGLVTYSAYEAGEVMDLVLSEHEVVGGSGVFPLAVGNEWRFVEGTYTERDVGIIAQRPTRDLKSVAMTAKTSLKGAIRVFDLRGRRFGPCMTKSRTFGPGHHIIELTHGRAALATEVK